MARQGLRIHPKFRRLVALLRMPEAHVLGHLTMLWESSYELGDVLGDSSDVEMTAGWVGVPGDLCAALASCGGVRKGFIEEIPGSGGVFRIHDLYDHAPQYVQKRMEREADRIQKNITISEIRRDAANSRWGSNNVNTETKEEECKQMQTDNTCSQLTANGCTPSPSPSPSTTNTPLPPAGGRGSGRRKAKVEEIGDYPQELPEAISIWRELLKTLRTPDLQEQFPMDKRFLPASVGTMETTWRAWEKHLMTSVRGNRVTNPDVLAAVRIWADEKLRRARAGIALAAPMLPTMINHPDFVDAVVRSTEARVAREVPDAS